MSMIQEDGTQIAPRSLIALISQHHMDFVRLGKGTLRCALRVGKRLIEARKSFEDQNAGAWAPREFGLSGHEAEIFMSFAARNSELGKGVCPANHLRVSALLELFARLTTIQVPDVEETSHAAAMCEDAAAESASIAPATANGQVSCGEAAPEGHVENEPVHTDAEEPGTTRLSKSQLAARAVLKLQQEGVSRAKAPADVPRLFLEEAKRLWEHHPELFQAVSSGELTLPQAKQKAREGVTLPREKPAPHSTGT